MDSTILILCIVVGLIIYHAIEYLWCLLWKRIRRKEYELGHDYP